MRTIGDNSQIRRIILIQMGFSLLLALVLFLFGKVHAWSALTGSLIATFANAFSASRIFVHYRAQESSKILARIYGTELQKLLLTGMMFAAAVILVDPLNIAVVLGAYLFVQVLIPLLVLTFSDHV
ncbi:ATP synthase subunit I [endosymbiont of Ridgeia piscesae]|uniref:ATP synthase subunit I n=1 Tax=endosymbiont of Ridgeia piscesae TaxID=54398 RepID=UPI000716D8AC